MTFLRYGAIVRLAARTARPTETARPAVTLTKLTPGVKPTVPPASYVKFRVVITAMIRASGTITAAWAAAWINNVIKPTRQISFCIPLCLTAFAPTDGMSQQCAANFDGSLDRARKVETDRDGIICWDTLPSRGGSQHSPTGAGLGRTGCAAKGALVVRMLSDVGEKGPGICHAQGTCRHDRRRVAYSILSSRFHLAGGKQPDGTATSYLLNQGNKLNSRGRLDLKQCRQIIGLRGRKQRRSDSEKLRDWPTAHTHFSAALTRDFGGLCRPRLLRWSFGPCAIRNPQHRRCQPWRRPH